MRVMILGAGGMIGHKLSQVLSETHDVVSVARKSSGNLKRTGIFESELKVLSGIEYLDDYRDLITKTCPDVVINCIGVIKQKKEAEKQQQQIYTNALFPHYLADICATARCKLINFSTDCVFSGSEGNYVEESNADPTDVYGRTKYLGEVSEGHCLTLRTSAIGHELFSCFSLVEWFLSHPADSQVSGYSNAIYSGFPTIVLASIIDNILCHHKDLKGLYHLSSEPISKFHLLEMVSEIYRVDISVVPDEELVCDRSLNSDRLRSLIDFTPRPWREMIELMHDDYIKTGYQMFTDKDLYI